MVKNITGAPVRGDDFFDRVKDQRRLWRALENDSVLLLAPRRVGKTSLLQRLEDTAIQHGFKALYCSVAAQKTEVEFFKVLYETLEAHPDGRAAITGLLDGPLKAFFKRVKKVTAGGMGLEFNTDEVVEWRTMAKGLEQALNMIKGQWLWMVDELPLFILNLLDAEGGRDRARTFLNWFRDLRIDRALQPRTRWLLAGSIGLDTVTRRERMGDTINDLNVVWLGAFSEEDAHVFLEQLGRQYQLALPEEVRQDICDRIGWLIPYHLQILFYRLRAYCEDEDMAPSLEAVRHAYAELMDHQHRNYFSYWQERLEDELGPELARSAEVILSVIAPHARGVSLDGLKAALQSHPMSPGTLAYLKDVLISDGYLAESEGRYLFRSHLLRDYWTTRVLS
ncbi:MAG: hypothetical protein ACE366_17640 [Bradymonadia bacterium]